MSADTFPCDRCARPVTLTPAGDVTPHVCRSRRDLALRALAELELRATALRAALETSPLDETAPQWASVARLVGESGHEVARALLALQSGEVRL